MTGGGIGNGVVMPDQAVGLVSLQEVMEDNKLSWEGFEKFGTVQDILEHNKCDHSVCTDEGPPPPARRVVTSVIRQACPVSYASPDLPCPHLF
jgi:hypothetical protein